MNYEKTPMGTKIDIDCAKDSLLGLISSDFFDNIDGLCRWAKTKQGHAFWREIADLGKHTSESEEILRKQIIIQEKGFLSLKNILEEV